MNDELHPERDADKANRIARQKRELARKGRDKRACPPPILVWTVLGIAIWGAIWLAFRAMGIL